MNDTENPPRPEPDQLWAVKIPTETFNQIKLNPEFCSLVTLARAVNALHFVLAPMLEVGFSDDPKAVRARYNSLAFTCALFAEVVPMIEGMQRYFNAHPLFQKVSALIHSKDAKELRKGNLAIRNKLVFHFDASEVQEQMKTLERENPTFAKGMGPSRLYVHNDLADLVTLRTFFGQDFPGDLEESRARLQTVAQVVVSFLVAADEFIVAAMSERNWGEMHISKKESSSAPNT
jgi:hypothetical protein